MFHVFVIRSLSLPFLLDTNSFTLWGGVYSMEGWGGGLAYFNLFSHNTHLLVITLITEQIVEIHW